MHTFVTSASISRLAMHLTFGTDNSGNLHQVIDIRREYSSINLHSLWAGISSSRYVCSVAKLCVSVRYIKFIN